MSALPSSSRCLLLLALFTSLTIAQSTDSAPARPDRPPSPAAFLGYELGMRFTTHSRIVSWLDAVDRASDRISTITYGITPERRELELAFIGSERNIARLEAIRLGYLRLADPRGLGADERERLIADLPAAVWLSFNVHGNETSCSEAAMMTIDRLISGDDEETRRIRDDVLVIIDPCANPDGRDRYVNWFNSVRGKRPSADPQTIEHDEPWPGGRFNHHCFDLNRDWAFMSQPETRARIAQYTRWQPQVHVDFHEMGYDSSYFFFPAERPINANLPPSVLKWGETFGRGNAEAFDRRGWRYYTAESFDLFYPGYGDSWPSFQGAIGMTYEQAGLGRSGQLVRRDDDTVLSLADRIEHHHVAAMATLATAAKSRAELLRHFHDYRDSALAEGRGGAVREYVLVPGEDRQRAARLVELLIAQGIEVRRALEPFKAIGARGYDGVRVEFRDFAAGVFLVATAQPTKRLLKTLLEPRTDIRELYFYDVAAWSLPLAFGVEAFFTEQAIEVAAEAVAAPLVTATTVAEGAATCGYLVSWRDTAGVKALVALLAAGREVRAADEVFTLAGREWQRGTLFVPRKGEDEALDELVRGLAATTGATFVPAATAMTEKGIDLGSESMRNLRRPLVAMPAGPGIQATSYGATRFLLEELYDLETVSYPVEAFEMLDFEKVTALVIPEGRPRFTPEAIEKIRAFVRDGGTLVLLGSAARAFSAEGNGFTRVSTRREDKDGDQAKSRDEAEKPRPRIEESEAMARRSSTPGSIFRVELDPAHPLAFGYGDEIAVFQTGMWSFDPNGAGQPVARFIDAPPLSGYILPESERDLRGRGYAVVEDMGRGEVVYIAGDPNFRSIWHGLTRLFLNAVLLLPRR